MRSAANCHVTALILSLVWAKAKPPGLANGQQSNGREGGCFPSSQTSLHTFCTMAGTIGVTPGHCSSLSSVASCLNKPVGHANLAPPKLLPASLCFWGPIPFICTRFAVLTVRQRHCLPGVYHRNASPASRAAAPRRQPHAVSQGMQAQ